MVQGAISGLETHQMFTQGAPPPHPWYCLSATMSDCFLFARLLPEIKNMWKKHALKHIIFHCYKNNWLDFVLEGKCKVAHSLLLGGSCC